MEINENVVTEEQKNEVVEMEQEPISGEVYDSEAEAAEATAENEHSGIGLAAGIALVVGGVAAVVSAKKLKQKLSKKQQKTEDEEAPEEEPEDPNTIKLTWKERLTGKVHLTEETKED